MSVRPGSKFFRVAILTAIGFALALSASFVDVASLRAEGLERHSADHSVQDGRGQPVSGTLRNIEFLPKVSTSRPPARPRKFLRRRNLQVQVERDEKYLQLLLVSVGFVGMLILILVLRSMPPAKKTV